MSAVGWIAAFVDGPVAAEGHSHDRHFSVGEPWDWIAVVEVPGFAARWAVVGGSGLPRDDPWPGQLVYRRMRVIAAGGMDGEPVAYYALAPPDDRDDDERRRDAALWRQDARP